jgi:hypothetical protein
MKKYLLVFIVLAAVILFSATLYSQPVPKRSIQMNETQIFENLLIGSKSCNKGLCGSCIYMMGELCCKESVIPLLGLLHNAECEEIRILAALSLCKIGDARGLYAVKRAAIFDDSERVKRLCDLFYKAVYSGKVAANHLPERG